MTSEVRHSADLILFDSSIVGGSGKVANPEDLAACVGCAGTTDFLIAGGLNPENVRYALPFGPWGVDVQSGVEFPVGSHQKSAARIRAFVDSVRGGAGRS
ncbi:MAG: hypothetical protein IPJ11_07475 [Gemmatimonadetes bacterium]|nr:hypothetical protein [Gemmatimonadota bacterium]